MTRNYIKLESTKYLRDLRRSIIEHFNLNELKTIAFDLGIPWDELPGEELSVKTQSLIMYLSRHGRLADLRALLLEERPRVDWPDIPSAEQQIKDERRISTSNSASSDDSHIHIEGDVSGAVIGGSRNIVTIIEGGVGETSFNRAQSDYYNNEGRKRIRAYGEKMAHSGIWDWSALGQAMEYYLDSIKGYGHRLIQRVA